MLVLFIMVMGLLLIFLGLLGIVFLVLDHVSLNWQYRVWNGQGPGRGREEK